MNITELFSHYGIPYAQPGESHHATKGWINLNCPNCDHNESDKFHLGYNIRGKYLNCWKCGRISLFTLSSSLGLPWDELKNAVGDRLPDEFRKAVKPKGNFRYPQGWQPKLLPIHQKYLRSRKFKPNELVKLWKLGSIGLAKRLAWRIVIPVYFQGLIVSWTTRSIENEGARYINARPEEESIPIKYNLFGGDFIRHSAIVVEGPFDAMRIGPGAVALLGTGYSQAQLLKLSKIPHRAICFDSEPEAQRRASKLTDALSVFPGKTQIVQLDADDPGSAKPKEIQLLRKEFLE